MSRRRKGAGTIQPSDPAAPGPFRPRLPGRKGKWLDACTTYDEARELLSAALTVDLTPGGVLTLRSWWSEYVVLREKNLEIADVDSDISRWTTHIEPAYFIDWPIENISPADVRTWLDGMQRKHHARVRGRLLGRSTITNTLNLLRSALGGAVERGKLVANPAFGIRLPKGKGRTHDPWTWLTLDEQSALIAHAPAWLSLERTAEFQDLIGFAMWTGMREGEVWNLEISDVDTARWRATVRYGSHEGSTKGKRIRRIPLFGLARDAVARQLARLRGRKNPHRLVWPTVTGERRAGEEPAEWSRWREVLGPDENRHDHRHVRWHDLRHTCGSSLIQGLWGPAWSLEQIQKLLGHKSRTTTERYAHLADEALDGVATSSHHAASATPRNHSSHLGNSNPGPTVYETGPKQSYIRELGGPGSDVVVLCRRVRSAVQGGVS